MPQAAPKPQERQKPVTFKRETPKVGRNDPCPVSYTHLDVYKRQEQDRGTQSGKGERKEAGAN